MYTGTAILKNKPLAVPPATSLLLDTYTGAAAAYSIRLLRTAYTGDAMNIIRASDSTATNIGFDGDGLLDTAAIASFCSGTTCRVFSWYDQSGNGLDFGTLGVNLSRPIIYEAGAVITQNGLPSLKFPTAGNYSGLAKFTNTSYINNGNQAEIFVVASNANTTAANPFNYSRIVGLRNASSEDYNTTNQFVGIWAINSPFNTKVISGQNNTWIYSADTAFTINTQYLINYGKNGTDGFTSLNDLTPATGTISAGNLAATRLQYGYDKVNGSDGGYKGSTQEVIVWNSEQSANRAGIKTNINTYYTIY
jgi:hypothetical protein